MSTSNFITIHKSARYHTLGDQKSPHLLFVLHGYGQLAEYFKKNFESLLSMGYYIVAPEGTHRFYLEGSSGRVGASWMTKELREQDIEENKQYLESLLDTLLEKHNYESISILGFSQGGPTAARWFTFSKHKMSRLILWACVFPEDVLPDFEHDKYKETSKYFVLGKEDEYFNEEQSQLANNFYSKHNFNVIHFDGFHKIDSKILHLLFDSEK